LSGSNSFKILLLWYQNSRMFLWEHKDRILLLVRNILLLRNIPLLWQQKSRIFLW